jgi:hypothetical protein
MKQKSYFGYDMNGNAIERSTVDELYRIADQEILQYSDFAEYSSDCTIEEDSFIYYATGTAFGATIDYKISATFTNESLSNNDISIYDFIDFDKDTIIPDFKNTSYDFEISFTINVVSNDVAEIDIDDIVVYNILGYTEYESKNLSENIEYDKLKSFIKTIAEPVINEIHAKLSNL